MGNNCWSKRFEAEDVKQQSKIKIDSNYIDSNKLDDKKRYSELDDLLASKFPDLSWNITPKK